MYNITLCRVNISISASQSVKVPMCVCVRERNAPAIIKPSSVFLRRFSLLGFFFFFLFFSQAFAMLYRHPQGRKKRLRGRRGGRGKKKKHTKHRLVVNLSSLTVPPPGCPRPGDSSALTCPMLTCPLEKPRSPMQ